ncbi:MAG: outer membrane beta-barrel protein [Vicinamibacterales bacterium]
MQKTSLGLVMALLAVASIARAQMPDSATATTRFGPFRIAPAVSLRDVGVDSNVFNEAVNPKSDFTMTFTPRVDSWLRAGRTLIWLAPSADVVYFRTYSNQRSLDRRINARVERSWNRFVPWASGSLGRERQRTNHEFDTRVGRSSTEAALGADLKVSPKVKVGTAVSRITRRHDRDALAFGNNLSLLLDRTTETVSATGTYAWTPLTTISVETQASRDRFPFSSDRDSDSVRVAAGLDFDPRALIAGRFKIGYRKFDGVGGGVPDFRGVTSMASLRTVVRTRTQLQLTLSRDLDYSFEALYPYYVLTSTTLSVIPRLTQKWDVEGRFGMDRLAYEKFVGLSLPDRLVRFIRFGGGVGYHLGRNIRLAFNVDRERRRSPAEGQGYASFRSGMAVSFAR